MKHDIKLTWEQAVAWLKAQPDRQDLVAACYYDDPVEDAARRYHASPEWKAVQKLLGTERGKVLDIGSGRGISAYALASDGWEVSALEPNSSENVGGGAIRRLSEKGKVKIEVVQDWGELLPFPDESFDLVYCRAVLHHAKDLNELCKEVYRVLRPGGRFLATREHVLTRKGDLKKFLKSHPLHWLYGGEHAYLLKDYILAIEISGLNLISKFNPTQNDINLHPLTRESLRQMIAKRARIPFSSFVPDVALDLIGALMQRPGRLYSFVAIKS